MANKVLVVDDEASLVELCRIILENAGYTVRGAINGREALKSIQEEMPDVVLLDVMMPGMDGIEVCREIRTRYEIEMPRILMYTADSRKETRENSLAAGANDLITKETPIFELPAKINSCLLH
ncbi:MAG: response regulator [Ardenticatenaceae bacterium]|nr:response regulator [Ardenticatenaceae bacterium]